MLLERYIQPASSSEIGHIIMAKSLSFNFRTRSVAVAWLMIFATIIGVAPLSHASSDSDNHDPGLKKHMPDIIVNKDVSAGVAGGRWRMRFDYSHFNYDGDNSH